MKPGKLSIGCGASFAALDIIDGLLAMRFAYWWVELHPPKWMTPTWDGLLLGFMPWLVGVISVSVD